MARSYRIDVGKALPGGVRKVLRAAEKPMAIAEVITSPGTLLDEVGDRAAHPVVSRRLKRCTIATRAHILAIADLPGVQEEHGGHLWFALLRVRVERPGGDVETCVRQDIPPQLRRLAPGSSVRALAHEEDPRFVVIDWRETARRLDLGITLTMDLGQYGWPDADDWPAPGVIEVRDRGKHERRLEERRAGWTPKVAQLRDIDSRGTREDLRVVRTLTLALDDAMVTVRERVPELAAVKLFGVRDGRSRFGGLVTELETVPNRDATLSALVSPAGDVAIDWQATLNQPSWRAT